MGHDNDRWQVMMMMGDELGVKDDGLGVMDDGLGADGWGGTETGDDLGCNG